MQGRRKAFSVIVTALTVSCALSVPTQVDSNNRSSLKSDGTSTGNHSQVLIIGAGVSGITAAARLMEHGVHDVTILEAENRFGGRVHSVPFGGDVVDLGAQWVHGCKGNVVYDMAKPLGLLDEGSPSALDSSLFLGANGAKLNAELIHHLVNLSCAVLHHHDDLSNYSGSLGQFFHERFTRWLSMPKSDIAADPSMIPPFVTWIEKILAYENGADSWVNISAKGLPQFWEIPGHQTMTFKKNGLSSVIDLLTKRYPNPDQELPVRNKTHLRTQVKTINWGPRGVVGPTGKKAVLVETSDAAKYTADFVIVTVSLGVLKTSATMFNPQITGAKLNTIKHLGFGEVEQLFFQFNETWWPMNVTGLSVLSTDEDRQRFKRLYPTSSEKGEWGNALTGLYLLSGQPHSVLFNWLTGESARNVVKYSDEEVMTSVVRWFEMYSNQKLPTPASIVRSKWGSNPHFRGSFSYRSVYSEKYGAWPFHLAKPLIGKDNSPEILFAGEATSNHHYSTVHGAIATGRREADRILDFLRKTKALRKASNKIY